MGLLIDASVLIAMERRGAALADLRANVRREPLALSALTVGELLVGVERADDAARRAQRSAVVESLLGAVPIVAFDESAGRAFAWISAAMQATGSGIATLDALLAAHAIARGDGVLTENRRHFAPDWFR